MKENTRGMASLRNFVTAHGGYKPLAVSCGVRWQTVQKWFLRGRVPIEHLARVEAITGIPRKELNPVPFRSDDAA